LLTLAFVLIASGELYEVTGKAEQTTIRTAAICIEVKRNRANTELRRY